MKKFNLIYAVLPLLMLATSCEIDNYDAPDAGIYGTLLDSETGTPVYTEPVSYTHLTLPTIA